MSAAETTAAPPTPSQWLDVAQMAAYLKVSEKTLYRLAASGALRTARVGRLIRGKASWCDFFLESQVRSELNAAR